MDAEALKGQVDGREWYHTIELAPGLETPGWFDTRAVAARLPWPDLTGKRCLDVGTFDGFWGFERERRGAAEVLACDILDPAEWDWPVGADDAVVAAISARKRGGDGFLTAAAQLGSAVTRHELSVYDLDPTTVGTFDLVYVGSLLLHLRDPIRALEQVRSVLRSGGSLLLLDAVDAELSLAHPRSPVVRLDGLGRPWWWKPNKAALARMVEAAGFSIEVGPTSLLMPFGAGRTKSKVAWRSLASSAGRQYAIEQWRGDPHAFLLARPRSG